LPAQPAALHRSVSRIISPRDALLSFSAIDACDSLLPCGFSTQPTMMMRSVFRDFDGLLG
jgi:hypothetical protein